VLDVIDGLQFVVDHSTDYNIRVVNLLEVLLGESYRTDPPTRRRGGVTAGSSS